jgi:hypothetical protein
VDLIVVADDLLLAASSHGSVVGLGKNTDEPGKKGAAHIWVPVHGNDGLEIDGRIIETHTPFFVRCKVEQNVPDFLFWGINGN